MRKNTHDSSLFLALRQRSLSRSSVDLMSVEVVVHRHRGNWATPGPPAAHALALSCSFRNKACSQALQLPLADQPGPVSSGFFFFFSYFVGPSLKVAFPASLSSLHKHQALSMGSGWRSPCGTGSSFLMKFWKQLNHFSDGTGERKSMQAVFNTSLCLPALLLSPDFSLPPDAI